MGGPQYLSRNDGVGGIQMKQRHEDRHNGEGNTQKAFVLVGVALFFLDQFLDALTSFGVEGVSDLISQAFRLFL